MKEDYHIQLIESLTSPPEVELRLYKALEMLLNIDLINNLNLEKYEEHTSSLQKHRN